MLDKEFKKSVIKYKREEDKKYKTKGKVYVSLASAIHCTKRLRLFFDGEKQDSGGFVWHGIENFVGEKIHEFYQDLWMKEGKYIEVEKLLSIEIENVRINMKVDGILNNTSFSNIGDLHEIKTIGSKDYKLTEPKMDHVMQLNFYNGIMGGNSAGFLSYFKRENGVHFKTFQIDFNLELYSQLYYKISDIILNNNIEKNTKDCRFCNYKEICLSDGNFMDKLNMKYGNRKRNHK